MKSIAAILPAILTATAISQPNDWLVDSMERPAEIHDAPREIVLENELVRRTWRLEPNAACVAFDNLMTGESVLRAVHPEARVTINGVVYDVGGLTGQPNHAYLRPDWLEQMQADPSAFAFVGSEAGEPDARMEWKRVRHHAPGAQWPPKGKSLRLDFAPPGSAENLQGLTISVHYELYDNVSVLCKWLTVQNGSPSDVRIDSFTSEILAAVEGGSFVGGDPSRFLLPNIHVETDYAFGGGMQSGEANKRSVRWHTDPQYQTQVHYARQTPCLLEVGPELGPAISLATGETFETFRTFELVHDSTERERKGLAVRRMYRTIAPWVTENPLMMHVRFADWDSVKTAIDQCAEVGFEMVILTFGSGFNIENTGDEYIQQMANYAAYASEKGIEIGGYSLLASRRISDEHDVIMPQGKRPQFGNSPCLESEWGRNYFDTLYQFYDRTGFMLLEHDGSYPGDECMSEGHPGHEGHADSRWRQWRKITDFYKWCRAQGIYLNVPDWYYLAGSTKCGMGYRETNWSLPRDQQVIHTRQNIYDGTWTKTPSMGWMFVPLTQYHGGGDAATIEPLDEHRDHYERMLQSNLALGAQACYRGPRLFDTDRTRDLVKHWVDWYKKYRDILESDVIHGRRADGRDIDWMLHVNPRLEHKGMLLVFNPLDEPVERDLRINLYYTGLQEQGTVRSWRGATSPISIGSDSTASIGVAVPARGMAWYVLE